MKSAKIPGTGCANCRNTIRLIDKAATARGIELQRGKVEGIRDIVTYGVVSTPGAVIAGKAAPAGGVPQQLLEPIRSVAGHA